MEERFEIVIEDEKLSGIVSRITGEAPAELRRICERYGEDEEDVRHYDAYAAVLSFGTAILKKADEREVFNYETYLAGKNFSVPGFYGKYEDGEDVWILIENIEGDDLRDMTDALALAAADSLSEIQNAYWQNDEAEFAAKKTDARFEVYWKRILRRAASVADEPKLRKAYQLFLDRQLTCPRTLSNGDCMQFNVIDRAGKVCLIDWGFGGIMPYTLDIARFIAHATEDRSTFPFYMTDAQKKLFCDRVYEKLVQKPGYERFSLDIQLAVLNEYIEFVEAEEDEDGWYYAHAVALADKLLK